jgi:DNA-binding NarL/FixJ family response regulator
VAAPSIAVVLCDDVPQLRTLLRIALSEQPDLHVVAEAGDGRAVIAAVAEHRPDAVVLDLAMPGVDGLQALPRIREICPDVAVVVFSGFLTGTAGPPAAEGGADAYLEKGTPLDDVVAAVRAAVASRRSP